MNDEASQAERSGETVFYVDGFNLYFGLRQKRRRDLYWLDLHALCGRLVRPSGAPFRVKFFTARVSATPDDPGKAYRQHAYLQAVATTPVETILGEYRRKSRKCRTCGARWDDFEEKRTDVNIAVSMLCDAFTGAFDCAVVMSGDTDLVPAIEAVRSLFPEKRLLVASPPGRKTKDLIAAAHAHYAVPEDMIRESQFPDEIHRPGRAPLIRPDKWQAEEANGG